MRIDSCFAQSQIYLIVIYLLTDQAPGAVLSNFLEHFVFLKYIQTIPFCDCWIIWINL